MGGRIVLLSALFIISASPLTVPSAYAQATDPRLGQAVGWAEGQLVAQPQHWNRDGKTYCGQFVEDAYAVPARLRTGQDTAWQIFLDIGTSLTNSIAGARPGDIVFFRQNASNSHDGHAGIYLGGDTMISVTDSGLRQSDVGKWSKYVAPLAGYAAPPSDWPGVGNTTPSSFSPGGACSEGGLGGGSDPPASPDGYCTYQLGFQSLRHLIPDVVGWCSANEHFDAATGDTQQATTEGLLVWRKADNWTAFTDGYHTWINGPQGLRERLNTKRFSWEANPDGLPLADAAGLPIVARPGPEASASFFLDARQGPPGLDTGIDLAVGQQAHIRATGRAGYGYEGAAGCTGYPQTDPDGQRYLNGAVCGPKNDPNAVAIGRPIGLLLARIGNAPWTGAGSNSGIASKYGGRLYLLYNEVNWGDNSGGYNVTISLGASPAPPPQPS